MHAETNKQTKVSNLATKQRCEKKAFTMSMFLSTKLNLTAFISLTVLIISKQINNIFPLGIEAAFKIFHCYSVHSGKRQKRSNYPTHR